MYSHKFIKDNLELLKKKLKLRGVEERVVEETYRELEGLSNLNNKIQELNEERNKLIEKDAKGFAERIRAIKQESSSVKEQVISQEIKVSKLIDSLPNIPDDSLTGQSEFIRSWGEIKERGDLVPHKELCQKLDLLSFKDGVNLSGSGFVVYKNQGARLYRALIEFTLKSNRERGYQERYLPVLLLEHSLYGTAQLPKFEEDLFKTTDGRYLSPTSESQLVNLYRNQIIEASLLPIKLTANTNCFRKEAGAAGMEDAGIIRLHQFCKTELVVISKEADSFSILEEMVKDACAILESLKLPYRVLQLAYDDMGFASSKTYDIEVWFPSENRYREISSVSNTLAFQAMRAKIRYKENLLDKNEKTKYPHILNGSSLAIDRLFAAIVDNYQKEGNYIEVPEALIKYLGVKEIRN